MLQYLRAVPLSQGCANPLIRSEVTRHPIHLTSNLFEFRTQTTPALALQGVEPGCPVCNSSTVFADENGLGRYEFGDDLQILDETLHFTVAGNFVGSAQNCRPVYGR